MRNALLIAAMLFALVHNIMGYMLAKEVLRELTLNRH